MVEKDGEDQFDLSWERFSIVMEGRNILHIITRRKSNWIGHILRRNCLVKHVIEGKTEVTGRRERRRKQLLIYIKKTRGFWNFKEEALDRIL